MNQQNQKYIIAIGGVLFVGLFLLWKGSSNSATTQGKVSYGDVDKAHKQEVARSRLEREKVNIENYKKAPQISDAYRPVEDHAASDDNEGLRLQASVSPAAKDIGENDLHGMAVESLENKINRRLLNEQQSAQMNLAQKRQIANEYKKKALSLGYQVELNDNLEVTKVQKVEAPKQIKVNPVIDIDSIEEDEDAF